MYGSSRRLTVGKAMWAGECVKLHRLAMLAMVNFDSRVAHRLKVKPGEVHITKPRRLRDPILVLGLRGTNLSLSVYKFHRLPQRPEFFLLGFVRQRSVDDSRNFNLLGFGPSTK